MSELKAETIIPQGTTVSLQMYPKGEVDKAIADLDESHNKEVKQLLILNREQANSANRLRDSMEQVIRHHKYKRCLAMANSCSDKASAEYAASYVSCDEYYYHHAEFWEKWHKRWLELAEQFKEAK